MAHRLAEFSDARQFRDAVMDFLLASEAECCVQIGLIERLVAQGYVPLARELDQPLLWAVYDGASLDLVVIQTLKSQMLVTRGSTGAVECLAQALAGRDWQGENLIGPLPSIEILAARFSVLTGRPRQLVVRLRTFDLRAVTLPSKVSGSIRICEPADRMVVAKFLAGFFADVGETAPDDWITLADRMIEARRGFFWVDEQPVAMAAWAGPTPNGIRINSVYTPSEFRGRGYASNLVAGLSQRLLDEGRKFCFLFTDLANPTSNSIYQKIGYRAVCDNERWAFGKTGGK